MARKGLIKSCQEEEAAVRVASYVRDEAIKSQDRKRRIEDVDEDSSSGSGGKMAKVMALMIEGNNKELELRKFMFEKELEERRMDREERMKDREIQAQQLQVLQSSMTTILSELVKKIDNRNLPLGTITPTDAEQVTERNLPEPLSCQTNDGSASKNARYDESVNANTGVSENHKQTNSEEVTSTPVGTTKIHRKKVDPESLALRQKQIDEGKNTIGYKRYLQIVPKDQREGSEQPSTPDKYANMSKRTWNGRVKMWRRVLHVYDRKSGPILTAATPNATPTESNPGRLEIRQKEIDFVKNTTLYKRYLEMLPKDQREGSAQPSTPDKYAVISKRTWSDQMSAWHLQLHDYNPDQVSVPTDASPNTTTNVTESPTIRSPVNAQQPVTEMKSVSESRLDGVFYEDSRATRNAALDKDDLL